LRHDDLTTEIALAWNDDDSDEYDDEEDGSDDLIVCPYCGESIYDDAVRCPHCEKYLSREDAPFRAPLWIVVSALLALGAAMTWVFMR
jgi:DNA-directed RNA polymerase subunit RPC12/RpoP